MNREILFRGKQVSWIYGGIHITADKRCLIINHSGEYGVEPESVGQFTELRDKNNSPIWQGDIVKFYHKGEYVTAEIVWNKLGMWSLKYKGGYVNNYYIFTENIEIVGNMFDNPKLLR